MKTITVSDETHKRLWQIKLDTGVPDLDSVIKKLLDAK